MLLKPTLLLLIVTWLMPCTHIHAQTPADSVGQDSVVNYIDHYYAYLLVAEEASLFGDFAESQEQYAAAFKRCKGFGRHYFAAAEAASRNLSADTAFTWMRLAARNGIPLKSFKKSTAFKQYHKTEEWLKFLREYDALYRAWINSLNLSLRAEILEMNLEDKEVRTRKNMRDHYDRIAEVDSIHLRRIERMIATKGFPGEKVIGNFWVDRNENANVDLIFQHIALNDSAKVLGILMEAVKRGECDPFLYAFTADMLEVWKGQPQVYGTFVTGKNRVYPLKDEANIDSIRATIGLEPFDLYCIKNRLKYLFLDPMPTDNGE